MAKQTTLEDQFKDTDWCNRVWRLVEDHTLTYVDAWLLCGNYKTMNELPSCEALNLSVPHTYPSLTLKEDLEIQRMIARKNFRGVVANKPVSMVRRIEDASGASQKHIYIEGDKPFTIEMGNEPFLPDNAHCLLKHSNLSREELIVRANELYRKKAVKRENGFTI
jgi:hypothetical protein